MYNKILPKVIRTPLSFIYKYTLGIIFGFIANITGYNSSVQKCYGFNVDKQIDNINREFTKIGTSFTDSFGKFDLSELKL